MVTNTNVNSEALRLLLRSRVWFALRQGRPVAIARLPEIVGLQDLDGDAFGFIDWWIRQGIIHQENEGSTTSHIKLTGDWGPRPPSWRGVFDPNQVGREREGAQWLWNVLRIARSGVGVELFRLAGVSSRVGVRLLRGWMRADLVRVRFGDRVGRGRLPIGMAAVVLVQDVGAIAPIVDAAWTYDPNCDRLVVMTTDEATDGEMDGEMDDEM